MVDAGIEWIDASTFLHRFPKGRRAALRLTVASASAATKSVTAWRAGRQPVRPALPPPARGAFPAQERLVFPWQEQPVFPWPASRRSGAVLLAGSDRRRRPAAGSAVRWPARRSAPASPGWPARAAV